MENFQDRDYGPGSGLERFMDPGTGPERLDPNLVNIRPDPKP